MWDTHHAAVGMGTFATAYMVSNVAHGTDPGIVQVIPAIIAGCWTHPFIDDANVGDVRYYHGIGSKLVTKLFTTAWRIAFWAFIVWLAFWQHLPLILACALPAWLICDHEWFYKWNVGYGIHHKFNTWIGRKVYMFPEWIRSEWGLFPVMGLLISFVMIIVLGII